jgi:hypothetical protein
MKAVKSYSRIEAATSLPQKLNGTVYIALRRFDTDFDSDVLER